MVGGFSKVTQQVGSKTGTRRLNSPQFPGFRCYLHFHFDWQALQSDLFSGADSLIRMLRKQRLLLVVWASLFTNSYEEITLVWVEHCYIPIKSCPMLSHW